MVAFFFGRQNYVLVGNKKGKCNEFSIPILLHIKKYIYKKIQDGFHLQEPK